MKTGTIKIIDGKYTDHFALGEIDFTHIYLKPYTGSKPPDVVIENGHVYHVAQLKTTAEGLYEAIIEWLAGARELENEIFIANGR
jgi:peroxiredoxin